jgi:hypothetical protein|uniref:CvpA family protein n=1 Tax=candidate division WOR-3 bacterium TaxID=2052148 RepID=A0A7C3Z258_UNCW3
MRFNPIDLGLLILVSTVAGIQFLRGKNNFSLLFFETLGAIGAGKVAYDFAKAHYPFALFFFPCLILFLITARVLNGFFPFSLGVFDLLFSFIFGITFGWAIGFGVVRSLFPLIARNPVLLQMLVKSWMASQIVSLGFLRELLALFVQAKYHNLPIPSKP